MKKIIRLGLICIVVSCVFSTSLMAKYKPDAAMIAALVQMDMNEMAKMYAMGQSTPVQVDERRVLESVVAEGTTVNHLVTLKYDNDFASELAVSAGLNKENFVKNKDEKALKELIAKLMISISADNYCGQENFRALIFGGLKIHYKYQTTDGELMGEDTIDNNYCDDLAISK